MENANLFVQFARQYADDPERTLLDTAERSYSWQDADRLSAQLSRLLTSAGLEPGDRVTVQVGKSPEVLWLFLACLRSGFVFHPLNDAYTAAELGYFVSNAEPSAVICTADGESVFRDLLNGTDASVFTLNTDGSGSLMDAAAGHDDAQQPLELSADALAALLYSSGTTGRPKGAMITHGNLAANMLTLVDSWGFTADDRLLHVLPVYHAHGLFVALGCVLMSGASMLWHARFDPEAVIRDLPASTSMMGVPTYYTRLLAAEGFGRECCANIRLFVSGSAPLRAETFADFEHRTGHRILERYGMTETCMNASNPLNGERRPGSVGPALPGVELRTVDDRGRACSPDRTGHLQVRGPNVFPGYWRMPEKTAEEFTPDGFFKTGDEAVIDVEGYVTIVGREKDMIITGGLNVYPREIELLLDEDPDISESAVFGVPHPDFGEAVVAVAVMNGGDPDAVLANIRPWLAGFKRPKALVAVDELPRNAMGKVQKNRLRDSYRNLFAEGLT